MSCNSTLIVSRGEMRLRRGVVERLLQAEGATVDVGTPILSFAPPDGPALFGPVIDTVPFGEDALRLWDATYTLATWPGFAELKRGLRSFPDTPLTARVAHGTTTVR